MSDGPVFVERIDYEAAASRIIEDVLEGLPNTAREYEVWARQIIDAALVGVRETTEEQGEDVALGIWFPIRRFVTDWEEVEE